MFSCNILLTWWGHLCLLAVPQLSAPPPVGMAAAVPAVVGCCLERQLLLQLLPAVLAVAVPVAAVAAAVVLV
jgi:hypothetical protein